MEYTIAPLYDLLLFPFVRPLRRRIIRIAEERGYQTVIDLCCGTGDQLKLLRRRGFQVAGVDISERMLAVSRRGSDAPECSLQDATSTSFPDASFDLATTTFALHEKEWSTARAILREMVRLVPVEGELLLADYHFGPETGWPGALLVRTIERIAGGEHYRNFRAFCDAGGTYQLVQGLPLEHLLSESLGGDVIRINIYRRTA
jgi:demethylmenaquinone methyltransferase/2-methoxy-6-polyprenyl-1,4-benzoquinol methylase